MDMFNAYLALFEKGTDEYNMEETYVKQVVDNSRAIMKREDRIVWLLRWRRLKVANQHYQRTQRHLRSMSSSDERQESEAKRLEAAEALQRAYARAVGIGGNTVEIDEALNLFTLNNLDWFKHIFSVPAPAIHAVRFGRQRPWEISDELERLEKEWKSQNEEVIDHSVYGNGIKEFLRIDDEWSWYWLDQASCEHEARAMGHCGNGNDSGSDRILSLRKHVRGNVYRPSLTFIIDDDGYLGEMKGRGNDKPSPKYHAAILALLNSDIVRGIKGGGYLPENNFSILDLGPEVAHQMVSENPLLLPVHDIGAQYATAVAKKEEFPFYDLFLERLESGLSHFGVDIQPDRQRIVLRRTPRDEWFKANKPSGVIAEFWTKNGLDDLSDECNLFREKMLAEAVYWDVRFVLPNVYSTLEGNEVINAVGLHEVYEMFEEEESHHLDDDENPEMWIDKVSVVDEILDGRFYNDYAAEMLDALEQEFDIREEKLFARDIVNLIPDMEYLMMPPHAHRADKETLDELAEELREYFAD